MIDEELREQLESGEEVLESGDEPNTPVTTKIELVETSLVDLTSDSLDIAQKIVEAKTEEELRKYTDLFNLSMAKKNAVRIVKLNSLYDKVTDEAGERIEKRSDEITNKELLDYMKALQDSIEKAQSKLQTIDNTQMITLNQQTNTVNVTVNTEEGPVRSRESKEKIIQAVRGLLKLAQESNFKSEPIIEGEVIDATPVVEEVNNDDEEVYIVEEDE